jgi:predicted O-linked N-acetylglucosamine transferase (SPINDLY family)
VQVNYLGYPGTLGAPYFDYVLADRTVIPDGERQFYREQVAYLPDAYQANDSRRTLPERRPSRREAGLPDEGVVFACFNATHKILPAMFEVWMRIMRGVPESVLWLLEDNALVADNLRREANARGVAPERLIFAPRVDAAQHIARQGLADLFLDTLPYNAHVTASDALWAGLPVLTCTGHSFAARVGASLLTAVGLPELITHSLDEFERKGLALASDPAALSAIKAKLVQNRAHCALFDTARITRHLESAYATMRERQRRGEPPASFAVAPL